jgi:hypothetical protein
MSNFEEDKFQSAMDSSMSNIDRSTPEAFSKSLEQALMLAGQSVSSDDYEDDIQQDDTNTILKASELAHLHIPGVTVRLKVKTVKRVVPKESVIDTEETWDFAAVTDQFLQVYDDATSSFTSIITEALAYRQSLVNVVEKFASQKEFEDLRYDYTSIEKLLDLHVMKRLCKLLKISKKDALKLLRDKVRK